VVYNNDVMEADYQDFQNLENAYENVRERKNMVRSTYGNTYWFYYEYE
jgi:aminoglycoside N3'-acetyltransferase